MHDTMENFVRVPPYVVAGLLLAFSGRVLGGVLIAIVGGGMLALSSAKWEGWIQGL